MQASKQFLPTAVALIFAAVIYADRVLSLSPLVELVRDYDKGEGVFLQGGPTEFYSGKRSISYAVREFSF